MNKKVWFDVAYILMILAVIMTCVFIVFYLRSSGKDCVADPIEYYSKNVGAECFCFNKLGFGFTP